MFRGIVSAAAVLSMSASALAQSHIHTPEAPEEKDLMSGVQFSGELRERATYFSALEYDAEAEAAGWFWTQRARLTADIEATSWLRARGSFLSALTEGGEGSPIERNDLDIQEGFVELGPENAYLTFGRQEIRLGSQRLVGVREGTNVRRTWDGARFTYKTGEWNVDAFALRLVDVRQDNAFNDGRNEGRDLAGVYVTGPAPIGEIDLYYLYAEFKDRITIEGFGDEDRHSIGARAFGEKGPIFWDWEAIYQFGEQGANDIDAWSVAANTGYRWKDAPWSPEIMLSANIASGDAEQGDGELGTFFALFPRGSYFSENALLGPSNFFNIHPYVRARPREDVYMFVDVNFYWRLEEEDGVYGPPGNILRAPLGSDERLVDISFSAGVEWEATENIFASVIYTHSAPQDFIEETGVSDAVDFLEFTTTFRF